MRPRHRLARHVDEERIAGAIESVEARTTGRIGVFLAHRIRGNIQPAAWRAFERLGLHRSKHRNHVLFFVIPEQRQFAVVGDWALHNELGQVYWNRLAAQMGERIRKADLTQGLIYGIEDIGEKLAQLFPPKNP